MSSVKKRNRPDPAALERAREHAQRKRVDAGLPAIDPDDASWEEALARVQRPKKQEGK